MAIDSYDFNGLYTITLDSIVCTDGQQTWTYTVTLYDQGISNWALEVCKDFTNENVTSTREGIVENPNEGGGLGNCLNKNNTIGCIFGTGDVVEKQIKWNTSTGGVFQFTVNGCYESQKVHVAIKQATVCYCGTILGPSCTETPPSRGVFCTDAME